MPSRFALLIACAISVGAADPGHRLEIDRELSNTLLLQSAQSVAQRLGTGEPRLVGDGIVMPVPLLGAYNATASLKLGVTSPTSSEVYVQTHTEAGRIIEKRLSFLLQAYEQELRGLPGSGQGIKEISTGQFVALSLAVPYATPFYVKDKVLINGKGAVFFASFLLLYEAASIYLIASEANFAGQAGIGYFGLVFNRTFPLLILPGWKQMNQVFTQSGYSYDKNRTYRRIE